MTTLLKLAAAILLPGGFIALAAHALLRCHHPHEMFDRDAEGHALLRCSRCHKSRPHPLNVPPRLPTGIERMRGEWREAAITDEMIWQRPEPR